MQYVVSALIQGRHRSRYVVEQVEAEDEIGAITRFARGRVVLKYIYVKPIQSEEKPDGTHVRSRS